MTDSIDSCIIIYLLLMENQEYVQGYSRSLADAGLEGCIYLSDAGC